MPADRFTKKANTPKKKRQWQNVYESVLSKGGSESSAIRQASGVIKNESHKPRRAKGRRPKPSRPRY
jgi:hypothetical protein